VGVNPDSAPPSPAGIAPPSGQAARIFTLLRVFWLWLLIPFAVHLQRKARREADESGGVYVWPRSIWNRPLILWLIVLTIGMTLIFAMAAAGLYGDPA
jgi:hypothetical protein